VSNDDPQLTDDEAREIADECVASIEVQIDLMIVNPEKGDARWGEVLNALTPKKPATLRIIEHIKSHGGELKTIHSMANPTVQCPALLATTCRSIIQALGEQGFDDCWNSIEDALERSDQAAKQKMG